jgi:hypothetical protein
MPSFREVITSISGLTHYYALDDKTKATDLVGKINGKVNGNVMFGANGATFDGKSSIELANSADFSPAGTASKALTIIAFHTVTDWKRQSHNNEYVHWMGKGRTGAHEWVFRYYIDGGSGEAATRKRRTSFYSFNPAGGLGTGSYFQDDDAAGVERVIGGMVWGNSASGSTQMWKNGVIRDTDALSTYSVNPKHTDAPVFLGSRGDNTGFLVGRLRRVAFFNRRLTEAEMKKIYDARNFVEVEEAVTPPPVVTPPAVLGDVYVGASKRAYNGKNAARAADTLVVFDDAYGSKTDTNEWGAEVLIEKGKVTAVLDQRTGAEGAKNLAIPKGGVVLSGHGEARTWLLEHAKVGVVASVGSPPVAPAPDLSAQAKAIRAQAAALRKTADELDATAASIEKETSG